jgi:hypothetical protein
MDFSFPVAAQGVGLGCLVAGIMGSNPAGVMDVSVLCLYVVLSCIGRGFCDELSSRPKESYPMSNIIQKPKNGVGKRR